MKAVGSFVLTLIIALAAWWGIGWATMLLVGALHSNVPQVPAISFGGALWLNTLMLWFGLIFGRSATAK